MNSAFIVLWDVCSVTVSKTLADNAATIYKQVRTEFFFAEGSWKTEGR